MPTIGDNTNSLPRQLIVAARRVQKSGNMTEPRCSHDRTAGPDNSRTTVPDPVARFSELRFDAPSIHSVFYSDLSVHFAGTSQSAQGRSGSRGDRSVVTRAGQDAAYVYSLGAARLWREEVAALGHFTPLATGCSLVFRSRKIITGAHGNSARTRGLSRSWLTTG